MSSRPPAIERLFDSKSSAMQRILDKARSAASSSACILITGENGTGKGILAKYLHELSGRTGAFVTLDMTILPRELLESELYGVAPRYLDSKHAGKPGLVHTAHQGSLLLDEIGDMPYEQQGKLLSFCQEHACRRVGSNQLEHLDVRLFCATNQLLEERIRRGLFRQDLFYRIRDIRIHLPPLRERPEDILPLALHCLEQQSRLREVARPSLSDNLLEQLLRHEWPGNLRELESCIRMMVEDHPLVTELTTSHLPDDLRKQLRDKEALCVASEGQPSLTRESSSAVDPSQPPLPRDPSYQRVPRHGLIHEVLTQYLLPKRVVALVQTHRGGARSLARQLASLAGLPTAWLIDSSCERSSPALFYGRLTRNDTVRDQVSFESWLRRQLRSQGSLLLISTQPRGPEDLLEEVAATIRGLLAETRHLHYVILGGERLLRLRSHERYSWLRLLPPGSLFDVPDLSEADVARLLRGCGLPEERTSWLHRQTGGHPWLLYELISQNIDSEDAALTEVKAQLSQSHNLDRHLHDPDAVEVLRKLLRNEPVADLSQAAIRRNPEKYPESRLYFDGFLIPTPTGTQFRCPAAKEVPTAELNP